MSGASFGAVLNGMALDLTRKYATSLKKPAMDKDCRLFCRNIGDKEKSFITLITGQELRALEGDLLC
jgi:hypothetical protein